MSWIREVWRAINNVNLSEYNSRTHLQCGHEVLDAIMHVEDCEMCCTYVGERLR